MLFSELGLPAAMLDAVAALGYKEPQSPGSLKVVM
jgi:hypothetical protein